MKRVFAVIAAVAIAGTMVGTFGTSTVAAQTRRITDTQCNRDLLARLRAQLVELKENLKEKEQQLRQARQEGNRALAARLMKVIREMKAEIEQLERRIRLLVRACGS